MNKARKWIKEKLLLLFLLLLITLLSLHFVRQKSGYFVDEGMTLFLANGTYNGAVTSVSESGITDFLREYVFQGTVSDTFLNIKNMLGQLSSAGNYSEEGTVEWYDAARKMLQGERKWINGKELFDQLTAEKGSRFQYIQVYVNQALDVHPPLYYLAVHTVFSFFPGTYSDMYLFWINMAALAVTCVFLYRMAGLFFQNKRFQLFTTAIFGLSQGFLSCAVYFRMYAMLTCFIVLTVYIHLKQRDKEEFGKKDKIGLIAVVTAGFYTHYYYIIFLAPLFIIYFIRYWPSRNKAWVYLKCMLIAAGISLVIWPLSLYHILFGYRGTEAVANLVADGLFNKLYYYLQIVAQAFTGTFVWIVCVLVVIGLGLLIRQLVVYKKETDLRILEIAVAAFIYAIVVIQIAPVISDRYIMCIYPIIALMLAMTIEFLIRRLLSNYANLSCLILVGVMVYFSCFQTTPNYLYLERQKAKLGIEVNPEETACLMVADDDWRGFPEAVNFSRFNRVMVLGENELEILIEERTDDTKDNILVYVLQELDQTEIIETVRRNLNEEKSSIKQIESDIEGFYAYWIEENEL